MGNHALRSHLYLRTQVLIYFTYRSSGGLLSVQPDTYEEGMLYLEGRRRWLNDTSGDAGDIWDSRFPP